LELFGVIGRKKEENNWGVVFDNDTHMPIVAVKIILLDETGKELITTYSDKDGRFGFLVEEGEYMLQIFKKGYTLFTEKTNDRLYGKLYNGKKVVIGRDNIISINIALKTEKINWTEFSKKSVRLYKFSVIMKYIFIALYILGFGATIIITIFYPSIFNFIILGIYIILVGNRFLRRKKTYGSIKTNDGEPVPFAVVNLYDKDSKEKHKFAVTDAIGRYYLLANNGSYLITAKGQPVSGTRFEKQGEVKVDDGIVRKDLIV